jgi:succinyl-CoA synthetase alpha subunit
MSMAILVDTDTRILVQGITGDFGSRHAKASLDYGTQLVAGVTPGKGGQTFEHGGTRCRSLTPSRSREAKPARP